LVIVSVPYEPSAEILRLSKDAGVFSPFGFVCF
jgi:hypothetical protein